MQPAGIREAVLAVQVRQDRDDFKVDPTGITLRALDGSVTFETLSAMAPPVWPWEARLNVVTDLLNAAGWATQPLPMLEGLLRVHAEPVGSLNAPAGDTWAVEPVHGGAMALGWGAPGVDPALPDRVVPIPDVIWALAKVDVWAWWGVARARQERDGELCALRWAAGILGQDQLRPVRIHDVITLLGARSLRAALTTREGFPMVTVGCPTRSTAWLVHEEVDLSFVTLAFEASEPLEQAFSHPLLITRDEVAHLGRRTKPRL